MMQTAKELARKFALRQALSMGQVIVFRYLLDLLEQFSLAFSPEQDLSLSEVMQLLG
jgi:hypothetical protein